MQPPALEDLLCPDATAALRAISDTSERILGTAGNIADEVLDQHRLDKNRACLAVVGSMGRHEAVEASDLDLLPIWCDGEPSDFHKFDTAMEDLRTRLRKELGIDVSTSRDLMKSAKLSTLTEVESIGGDADDRRKLTQRVLLLTESSQAGGHLSLDQVRRAILAAYVGDGTTTRTASRHPLAVCNDIARYYRTVCMDYKSRAESKPENWCLRLLKLRGARKFWYFSTLLSVSSKIVDGGGTPNEEQFDALAQIFSTPPIRRLYGALADADDARASAIDVLNAYLTYLHKLSSPDVRSALNSVEFESRMELALPGGGVNPFPDIYNRSKELHRNLRIALMTVPEPIREKAIDWFLL